MNKKKTEEERGIMETGKRDRFRVKVKVNAAMERVYDAWIIQARPEDWFLSIKINSEIWQKYIF